VGQVTVRVNSYAHTIGCKDGEEAHVIELASRIEAKTKLIRSMGGQFSEARMLLHVALLLADEANDLRAEVARLSAGAAATDPRIADRLARIAERIEGIAGAFDAQAAAAAAAPAALAGESPGTGNTPAAGRG
jgi:cell division protein ZapA